MSSSCAQWRRRYRGLHRRRTQRRAGDQVTRHLAACAGCRADYDELVPVRDWLGLLDVMPGAPQPGPARKPAPAPLMPFHHRRAASQAPGSRPRPQKRRRQVGREHGAAGGGWRCAGRRGRTGAREVGSDKGVTVLTPRELDDALTLVAQG
jgi:hypothetical protein